MHFATSLVQALALASLVVAAPAAQRCRSQLVPDPGAPRTSRNDLKTRVSSVCAEGPAALVRRGVPEDVPVPLTSDDEQPRDVLLLEYPYAARSHHPDCPVVTPASPAGDWMEAAQCRMRARLRAAMLKGTSASQAAPSETPVEHVDETETPQAQTAAQIQPLLEFHLDEPVQRTQGPGGLLRHLQGRPYRELLSFFRVPIDDSQASAASAAEFYRHIDVDEEAPMRVWSPLLLSRRQGVVICVLLAIAVGMLCVSVVHDFYLIYVAKRASRRSHGSIQLDDVDAEKALLAEDA